MNRHSRAAILDHYAHALRLLILALLVAGLVLIGHPIAYAASITVTTTTDELNSDGDCSLREAIRAANLNASVDTCPAGSGTGTDTITLPTGTYILTINGQGENDSTMGDLDLTEELVINGDDAATTIIDGNAQDRVFEVQSGAIVTLKNVTMRNGDPGMLRNGGAIFNSGRLTVMNSNVMNYLNNGFDEATGTYGGGIFNHSMGTLELINSTIGATTYSAGGGIYNLGTLIATDSTIHGATIYYTYPQENPPYECKGGGIYNGGTATITSSTVSGFLHGAVEEYFGPWIDCFGAGIYNKGTLRLAAVTISGAFSDLSWSNAIHNDAVGTLSIVNSIFRDISGLGRVITNDGMLSITRSYISGDGEVAGISNGGVATITDSTITKGNGYEGVGGGIANSGVMTVTNSTISGNFVSGYGNENYTRPGGGIYNSGTLALVNSTITNNRVATWQANSHGGGIKNEGTVMIRNTIIAGNHAISSADCSGTLISQGYNLIQDTAGCTITGDTTGNLLGVNPRLGSLQNNRGPTPTHALLTGSPAIDVGPPATPGNEAGTCPRHDQRGIDRPQDGNNDTVARCDIGAVERISTDPLGPVIIPSLFGTLGANGWYTSDVTVTWRIETESAITMATGCESTTLVVETHTTLTCSVTNELGQSNTVAVSVKIDKTAPRVTIFGPEATSYDQTQSVSINWYANDDPWGWFTEVGTIATLDEATVENYQTLDLSRLSLGAHTLRVVATDDAGNSASATVTFTVTHTVTNDTWSVYVPLVSHPHSEGETGEVPPAPKGEARVATNPHVAHPLDTAVGVPGAQTGHYVKQSLRP